MPSPLTMISFVFFFKLTYIVTISCLVCAMFACQHYVGACTSR